MRTINELMNLQGRRALITGATGGLGKHMAATIVELGGSVILVDRPGSNYSSLVSELKENSAVDIKYFDCDLENEDERKILISRIKDDYSLGLDILINNAAFGGTTELSGWVTKFEDQSVETWRRAIEVNLTAAFDLSKGFAEILRKNRHGSIINVSSIYGINGPDFSLYEGTEMGNPAAYAVSKGGLIQLTRWLATTIAPDIRVNSISPGGVWRNQPDEFVKRYEAKTPLGRMATEEDFKGIIAYLSSDLSAYVTGQNIVIDGGWTVW
jgi:NAD(P)-dependent dehydrogenase (short-subunit alcohol dehydrogenase family)